MENYKFVGTIECYVKEPNGKKRLVQKTRNTIATAFGTRLALNLITDQDMRSDNLFGAVTSMPVDGEDGIVLNDNTVPTFWSMITTKTHPTTTTVVYQGTFTGHDIYLHMLTLGNGWVTLGKLNGFFNPNGEGGFTIATSPGTGWVPASFIAAQTVVINWTIEAVKY